MTAGTALSNNVVTDNPTDVSRTWATSNGGTHVVSSVNSSGLSQIYIQNVATTNTQLRLTSISITYGSQGSSTETETTITINSSGISNTDLANGTAAGTLTASVMANGSAISGASVTWDSSNEDVATISNSGVVTLVGSGTTIITASYSGVTGTYKSSSATYELTVSNSNVS